MGILSSLMGGANKFSNELLNPTTGLGRLGAYISAAAGTPLGEAAMAYQHDQRSLSDAQSEQQLRIMQAKKLLQPPAPHYWQTNDGSLAKVDPATGQPNIVYHDPTPKVNWLSADDGNGGKTFTPIIGGIPQLGSPLAPQQSAPAPTLAPPANAGPPPEAVDYLRSNPTLGAQFDQKYGVGASAKILGTGGVGTAGGHFPRISASTR